MISDRIKNFANLFVLISVAIISFLFWYFSVGMDWIDWIIFAALILIGSPLTYYFALRHKTKYDLEKSEWEKNHPKKEEKSREKGKDGKKEKENSGEKEKKEE